MKIPFMTRKPKEPSETCLLCVSTHENYRWTTSWEKEATLLDPKKDERLTIKINRTKFVFIVHGIGRDRDPKALYLSPKEVSLEGMEKLRKALEQDGHWEAFPLNVPYWCRDKNPRDV